MYGSPLSITIQGTQYHGWAEIVDNPEEIRKEWRAIIKNKPELASQLNINVNKGQEADLENILAKVSSLKILRIEISGKR